MITWGYHCMHMAQKIFGRRHHAPSFSPHAAPPQRHRRHSPRAARSQSLRHQRRPSLATIEKYREFRGRPASWTPATWSGWRCSTPQAAASYTATAGAGPLSRPHHWHARCPRSHSQCARILVNLCTIITGVPRSRPIGWYIALIFAR